MPSELDIFQSLPRRARRRLSRDTARAMPIPPRPKSHGLYADLVNARVPMPHNDRPLSRPSVYGPTAISGQARVNAKRNQRAAFWRSVKILVSGELEPYFRKTLHRLGHGARIQGCTKDQWSWSFDFDVHFPGIPAGAVRGEPVFYSDWNGEHHVPRVDYIVFYDAAGQVIDVENGLIGAAS